MSSKKIKYGSSELTEYDWTTAMSFQGMDEIRKFLQKLKENGNKLTRREDRLELIKISAIKSYNQSMSEHDRLYRIGPSDSTLGSSPQKYNIVSLWKVTMSS